MREITRNNYEEYFIDYFDGELNNHEIAELMLFLAKNNDLDNEFNNFKIIKLKKEKIKFNFKKELKKQNLSITGNLFADKCIDKIENNLTLKDDMAFERYLITNKEKQEEFNNFNKTIISPDLNIIYPNKNKLKKQKTSKTKLFYQYAAIIMALVITFTITTQQNKYNSRITHSKETTTITTFDNLSSFDKYDNQQAFTIIKTETPNIVAKSNNKEPNNINANKNKSKMPIAIKNKAQKNKFNLKLKTIPVFKTNNDIYVNNILLSYKKTNYKIPPIKEPKTLWYFLTKKNPLLSTAPNNTSSKNIAFNTKPLWATTSP